PLALHPAITLTGKLGFFHLWIDSLCIVQDPPPSDWASESQKMMHIYQNCFLTIAATSSPDSSTSLF
ncbi:hypothetical protein B0T14DRAFT_411571, partial [Immersiella caudata]